jgi:hypothetical protein
VDATTEYHLTTTAGGAVTANVIMNQAVPGQNQAILPVLQLEDSSFVGAVGSFNGVGMNSMVAFDASGNVRWTVPNDSPQMATADGGIIGSSGSTYDANGSATGQLPNLPQFQSWLGNGYNYGPIEKIFSFAPDLALTFAALQGGNASANGAAIQQQWYPALPSCQDTTLVPPISCPGPQESMKSALMGLKSLVADPCLTCGAFVFQPLGSINDQTAFFKFLNHNPGLYDGTRSNMPYNQTCAWGSWNGFQCSIAQSGNKQTVAQTFRSNPGVSAISQMPAKNGLLVFLDPSQICKVYASRSSGIFNQSRLFHEALHGFYGKDDPTIEQAFGLTGLAQTEGSRSITFYIQQNVFGRPQSVCGN